MTGVIKDVNTSEYEKITMKIAVNTTVAANYEMKAGDALRVFDHRMKLI